MMMAAEVRSMFAGGVEKIAEFPATSVTVTLVVSILPSPPVIAGLGMLLDTPERLSAVL